MGALSEWAWKKKIIGEVEGASPAAWSLGLAKRWLKFGAALYFWCLTVKHIQT
jgi:hypothetical protein